MVFCTVCPETFLACAAEFISEFGSNFKKNRIRARGEQTGLEEMKPAFHAKVPDDAAPAALGFFRSAFWGLDLIVFPLLRGDSLIWSPTPSFCEEREGSHAPQFQTLSFPPRNENRLQEFTLSFALRWPGIGAIADPRWSGTRD